MPYLTADDQQNVTHYEINLDEQITLSPARQGATPDSVHLWFDLSGVSVGDHTVIVKAKNMWGYSEPSPPFYFAKELPGVLSGITLVEE